MQLRIDRPSVDGVMAELDELMRKSNSIAHSAELDVLNGAYSTVSGLDQLGDGHGRVMHGGAGSAEAVLVSYSEQIQWLRDALKASVEALNSQDELFARGMDIADTGGQVGEGAVSFPVRPAPRFDSFSFTSPVVRAPSSIDELCSDFSGTNSGAVSAAQSSWTTMSSTISEVSESLRRVAGELLDSNAGEVFEQASLRITEVAEAGSVFAGNAKEMSRSVGTLNSIYTGHKMSVFMAALSISMIKEPAERAAAESTFLGSFESAFQSDVRAGVPGIDNLMRVRSSDGSGGGIALGMSEISGSGAAFNTQGLTPQGLSAAGGGVASAPAVGAGSFGTVGENLDGMEVSDLKTSAASVGAGSSTMSNTAGMGGVNPLGSGGGVAGSTPIMGMTGRHGINGGITRSSNAGLSPLMNARTQSASAMGPMGPMMGAAGGGGVGGAATTGANGARGGVKQALAQSGHGASTSPTQSSSGLTGGAVGKASQSTARPMMPMMPMSGAGGAPQRNTGKVKTVTSAVEQDANIAALLGNRGPVVPGVIGDWVRR